MNGEQLDNTLASLIVLFAGAVMIIIGMTLDVDALIAGGGATETLAVVRWSDGRRR